MTKFFLGFSVGCLVGTFVATAIEMIEYRVRLRHVVREMMEREAVFAGHAEWVPGDDGRPVFSWKPCL